MPSDVKANQQCADERLCQLLAGLTAVRGGDFSTRLPPGGDPVMDEIAAVFNGMNDQLGRFTAEVIRVAIEVGTDGKLGGQSDVHGIGGTWRDLTGSVEVRVRVAEKSATCLSSPVCRSSL